MGFDPSYVQRVGHGRITPTAELREAMAELLGMPVEVLFTRAALQRTYREDQRSRGHKVVGDDQ